MADWRTDDRELLARILMAEAGNQGPVGMTAVGNVIMNRANTTGYGDGIRGVIMKPGQFSPMNSVTGYAGGEQGQNIDALRPSATHYMVADALMSGNAGDITGGATHFFHPGISNPSWASGKQFSRIGDHVFGSADAGRGSTQATTTTQGASPMMQEEQQPRGLLGSLGIQKMEEGAAGETGQRFYERDTFKDTAAALAQGFAAMGSSPALQKMTADIAGQRSEAKARNKTVEYFRANGRGDLADMVEQGMIGGREAAGVMLAKPEDNRTALIQNYEYFIAQGMDPEQAVAAVKTGNTNNLNMSGEMSPGLKKLDESFAETYANLSMSGLADARSQAATISAVLEKLEAGEQLTGPLIGAQPDFLLAITNPDAQDAIDRVGSVVQRSLREVLGGQFAQKEGEQLVRRAYNPSLPPAQNAARLRALFAVLDQTAKNKMDMAAYYQGNRYSLGGYRGNLGLPSAGDLYAAMDAAAAPATGTSSLSAEDQALVDKYLTPKDGG